MIELTADCKDGGVVGIGNDECKLGTCVPTLRGLLWISVIKVNGNGIIRGCIRISKGK